MTKPRDAVKGYLKKEGIIFLAIGFFLMGIYICIKGSDLGNDVLNAIGGFIILLGVLIVLGFSYIKKQSD